ncbi:MAG TPA: FUSC family protein [Magnetospirillaceae bacterium]
MPIRETLKHFRIVGYSGADMVAAFKPDGRALRFAARTTAAAAVAVAISMALGFHQAYWSAITAWVLAVPDRGTILPKAFFRTLGTLIGAGAALVALPLASYPTIFIVALTVWVGLCAMAASRFRRFQAYVAQLAGYTATIVAVVGLEEPEGHAFDAAIIRLALVLVGIASSAFFAFLFAEPIDEKRLQQDARQLVARTVRWAAALISEVNPTPAGTTPNRDLWMGLSDFESACEYAAFESSTIRQRLPAIRRLTAAELSLVASARAVRRLGALSPLPAMADVRAQMTGAAKTIAAGGLPTGEIAALQAAAHVLSHAEISDDLDIVPSALGERVNDLADGLDRITRDLDFLGGKPSAFAPAALAIHGDWRSSISIGSRAALATLAIGLLWHYLNWAGGAFAFIFTSVACLLFGVQPRPTTGIARFAFGVGIAATIFILWHAIPSTGTHGEIPVFVAVAVLTFIGAIGLANRFPPAMDFNANFTGLMLGAGPALVSLSSAIEQASALAAGIGFAYLAFVVPLTGAVARERHLQATMSDALAELATGRWRPLPHKWEARMYDMLNRSAMARVPGRMSSLVLRRCLLTLDIGLDLLRLQSFARSRLLPVPEPLAAVIRRALEDFSTAGITESGGATMAQAAKAALAMASTFSEPAHQRLALRSAAAMDVIARCCAAWISGAR